MGIIKGRLVDSNNKGVYGELELEAVSGICRQRIIGHYKTDSNGYFRAEYPETYGSMILKFFDDKGLIQVIEIDELDKIIDVGEIKQSSQNIAIKGKIIDENGKPLAGLKVSAVDVDIGPDDFLGCAWTDHDGRYIITYDTSSYHFAMEDQNLKKISINPLEIIKKSASILDRNPDIMIKVYDKLGIFKIKNTKVYSDVEEVIKEIDDIIIPRSRVEGWQVTLDSGSNPKLTHDNTFQPLIDNERALEKILNSIENSKSYLYLTQFEFRPDFLAKPEKSGEKGITLGEKLIEASQRGVNVRILVNQNLLVPDDYDEIAELFNNSPVLVRPFTAQGPHVMHAKILLVDGKEAFIIGSPFTQSYWDTIKHYIIDLRRGSKEKQPVHDVSIHIKGGCVPFIEEYFVNLWNYLSHNEYDDEDMLEFHESSSSAGNHSIQLVRTITPETFLKDGEKGVLDMYRRAIGNAQEFIYMENQYFTNKYIVKALKVALERNKDLQLILVINGNPDIPTYRLWQHKRLKMLGLDLDGPIFDHPQIGVYNLWGIEREADKFVLQPFYIHSKVSIVDDKWATIGTANLDGSSLSGAEEFKSISNPQMHLNMEANALLLDLDESSNGNIKKFREELWGEHLGLSSMKKQKDGWLGLWKNIALKNVELLKEDIPTMKGNILPYTPARKAANKIQSLDILNDNIKVMD
ncbi:MAG: phospholipase D-like domain-containing protein [Methanobacteriaceae archaeon]|nr:phospholipase D-like domain-containing protein [Methanobacteriaceae archaeon]